MFAGDELYDDDITSGPLEEEWTEEDELARLADEAYDRRKDRFYEERERELDRWG